MSSKCNGNTKRIYEWIDENGIQMNKCEIHEFENTGRGIRATEKISRSCVIISLPDTMVLMPENSKAYKYIKKSNLTNNSCI